MPATPAVRTPGPIRAYFRDSSGATQSAALTLPLLAFYGIGVLLLPEARNGVDFLSNALHAVLSSLGGATGFGYLTFYLLLIGVNVGLVAWLSSKNRFNAKYFLPLVIECAVYAVLVGSISGNLTRDLTGWLMAAGLPLSTTREMGPLTGLVVSAGAGLHEEFVFRLVGIGGIGMLWLGKDWRRPSLRLLALVIGTAVVFSAAHHLVEPFTLTAFVFRTVAGIVFAGLFLARGFAVAAWTHALYDVWVIVVLGR